MNIAFFGECLIELSGQSLQRNCGGDMINVAVYLARLGASREIRVAYATGLGIDRISESMRVSWQLESINTELVQKVTDKMPGLCLIETDDRGNRRRHYWRNDSAARYYFHQEHSPLERAILQRHYDVLFFSGISIAILTEEAKTVLISLLQTHCSLGGKVVFDNCYRACLMSTKQGQYWYTKIAELAEIVFVREEDEQAVWGKHNIMRHYQALGCQEVVMLREPFASKVISCLQSNQPQIDYISFSEVKPILDSTSAIEGFLAGYLAGRWSKDSPRTSAELGHQVSNRILQHLGAIIPKNAMTDLIQYPIE
jgi:2-dehydro-3-deoxygluconokinase